MVTIGGTAQQDAVLSVWTWARSHRPPMARPEEFSSPGKLAWLERRSTAALGGLSTGPRRLANPRNKGPHPPIVFARQDARGGDAGSCLPEQDCCFPTHVILSCLPSSDIPLMCGSATIQGYRLMARRHHQQAPGGSLQVDWIALAMSATQADCALRATIGIGWDVTLVAAGPAITKEAHARGQAVGFVTRL